MTVDLELYRNEVRVSENPPVTLSIIDIAPELPRRTLIFLHGFGGQARQWQYQLLQFSTENRVIAIDLRGHGRSTAPPRGYSMEQILVDLETALDKLQVEGRVVLLGHSFGGAVASEFAVRRPELLEALVLIATAGEYRLNMLYRMALNLPGALLRLLEPLTRNWLSATPAALKPWYHQTLSTWNGWSVFRSLAVPTLVVRGHLDTVFEKPMYEEVARAIPTAEEVDVGVSGHMVMLERRDAVNRNIQRFLEGPQEGWRDPDPDPDASARAALLHDRPWLAHYDEGVPYTVAIPNAPLHQMLRSSVRRFPLRTAIQFEGTRLTYLRLYKEVNRFANALRSLGVDRGDRVMLLLPNLPQLVIAFYGVLKAGGVAVFSLLTHEPQELARQARESGARVVVTLDELAETISALKDQSDGGVQHLIVTSSGEYLPTWKKLLLALNRRDQRAVRVEGERVQRFDRLLYAHSGRSPEVDLDPNDPAVIQYTGGTTSHPKAVVLSHRNLVANTMQTRHWMPEAREGRERFLSVLPFYHIYGLTTALNLPVAIGGTMILKARFEVADVLQTIKRQRPSIFPGVPNMYLAIKDFPGVRKYGIASINACLSGSAPLPIEVQEAFEKLTRGRLVEGYGLTEASPATHANPLLGRRKVGTIGVPLPSTEARVVDLKRGTREMKTGQIGELAVRGPQVMGGYWQDPKGTRAVLSKGGWLLTGDVAQMDAEGYFRIISRKADIWYPESGEEPLFPRDVEEVLFEIPQVKDAAVVAVAGKPIAFLITGKDRPAADAVIAYCKRRLPPELVPRLVLFMDEFPRTFIGKVLRRELAKRYEQQEH